ncbi:MAG: 3-oxoacyl-[acyl-carrier-protein] synthase-1, partial [Bacteroidia bacterium]
MNRVVITGRGVYSCLGKNVAEATESLKAGRSGIIYDPIRKEMGFRSALVGNVELPDLKKEVGRKDRKAMPEQAMYAFVSTNEALENAGMSQDFIDQNEVGILFGNDSTAGAVIEGVDLLRAKKDTTLIGSGNI